MRIFRRNIAFLVLLAALAAACETRPATPTVAVDSAGVRIVTSYPLDSDVACAVGEEPLLVIGDRQDDPSHLFGSVTGVARLSDGSVAVADRSVGEVRIFDATGEHLRSFGGFGDGPGEFRRPWNLWVRPGDTLWVGDYRPWRYNVFAADGQWSRAVQLDPLYPNPSRGGGVLSGGALIAAKTTSMSQSFETPNMLVVEAHDPDGKFVGVLARLPNMRQDVLSDGSGGDMYIQRLFDSSASASARGDRIALGTSSEPEVRILDSEYRLTTIVRWDAGDRSVRTSDVDAFREEIRARQAGRGELNPVDAARISPQRPVADVFPAFQSVLLGNAGHLFVFPYRRPDQPVAAAMVFAPTGEFMCHMEPKKPGFSVWEAGSDYLLGVHLNELDVATVKAYSFGPHAEGA